MWKMTALFFSFVFETSTFGLPADGTKCAALSTSRGNTGGLLELVVSSLCSDSFVTCLLISVEI